MDGILAAIGKITGRIIGGSSDCGLDCDMSDFGAAEYLILAATFLVVFVLVRALIKKLNAVSKQ